MKKLLTVLCALSLFLGMGTNAFAWRGGGHHGYHHGWHKGGHHKGNPRGWHHGNKAGWHGRGMPPGRVKKGYW
ncbi:hypothetical protein [Legionella maioricensis]|uniref:Uncharacterized protein n=1 Tax=Legionella maioricensis TaxID=2896528 RepID=A0A9X2ICY0_9GAMM|nr:hypothetical protein [Legionella maioricensis]MCL9684952.1 hypothetical protein [Legionella maioricensis]MCL9688216.1 hypothetical protein [Legionella maioricensis]